MNSPIFKKDKIAKKDLPRSKRQSTIIIKAGKIVDNNTFNTQKTQINRRIQRSMGSNLSIERKFSQHLGDGSNSNNNKNNNIERKSYKMAGTIFKAS